MRSSLSIYHPYTSWLKATKLAVYLAIPLALFILPADYFDSGSSISVFAYFGVEDLVYSTGMTRSVMHLLHGDFSTAMEFNQLGIIVLPLLVLFWLKLVLKEVGIKILHWF